MTHKMRKAIELVESIKNDPEPGTITQYSYVRDEAFWPELEDLSFRQEIETLMYREDPRVTLVYFTRPEEQVGWAMHVIKGVEDGLSN